MLGPAAGEHAVFPWLIKFLDAGDWLSVQVHPDEEAVTPAEKAGVPLPCSRRPLVTLARSAPLAEPLVVGASDRSAEPEASVKDEPGERAIRLVWQLIPRRRRRHGHGTTTVQVTATDAAGNVSKGSFTVTVQDTTPPSLSLPSNQTLEATGPNGAIVHYAQASATDAVPTLETAGSQSLTVKDTAGHSSTESGITVTTAGVAWPQSGRILQLGVDSRILRVRLGRLRKRLREEGLGVEHWL
jgi:hypothetical protein